MPSAVHSRKALSSPKPIHAGRSILLNGKAPTTTAAGKQPPGGDADLPARDHVVAAPLQPEVENQRVGERPGADRRRDRFGIRPSDRSPVRCATGAFLPVSIQRPIRNEPANPDVLSGSRCDRRIVSKYASLADHLPDRLRGASSPCSQGLPWEMCRPAIRRSTNTSSSSPAPAGTSRATRASPAVPIGLLAADRLRGWRISGRWERPRRSSRPAQIRSTAQPLALGSGRGGAAAFDRADADGPSAALAVAKHALGLSDAGGGLGALFPLVIAGITIFLIAYAFSRRRRAG